MAENKSNPRRTFQQLERRISFVVFAQLALFVVLMAVSCAGITWLKVLLGLVIMAVSVLGCLFLVLIGEHKRTRSWWILSAFASLLLCTLVSLITGSPA